MNPSVLIPLLIVVFVPTLLVGIMYALSRLSGWREFSRRWPRQPVEPGAQRGLTSIMFPPMLSYNNCIYFAIDDHHLHIRMMPVFSMYHPPMSIPWAEVTRIETSVGPFKMLARLRIGGHDERTLYVRPGLVRRELEIRRMIEENERAAVEEEIA